MTLKAQARLREAEVIIGYRIYIDLIRSIVRPEQEVVDSGMTREVERCTMAVERAAKGQNVAVVSSGDPGVYGMAGVVLELVRQLGVENSVTVEIIPGISAAQAAAASLGAPLMHDFAIISLSDLLTDWEVIRKRVEAAASTDFVIALYNPKSRKRVTQVEEVRDILLRYRGSDTPVGIVRNAKRGDETIICSNLAEFTKEEIDMFSVVIIGNSHSYWWEEYLITPRGYEL